MRRITVVLLALTFALHSAPSTVFAQGTGTLGTLSGTLQNSAGQALTRFTAQLRNVQTGLLVGKTMSGAAGSFSFTGLSSANYVVEVVDVVGQVIGTSAVTQVAPGANVAVAVQAAGGVGASGGGINMAVLLTVLAAGVGSAALVVGLQGDSSPSR